MPPVSLPEEIRAASAWVVERARSVRVREGAIEEYAAGLPRDEGNSEPSPFAERDQETAAAFAISMNAINFGSGWWPTIRKRPGHSGYATMAAGVADRFSGGGPWSANELAAMDAKTIAVVLDQDAAHPLMAQFAAALRDVGTHLQKEHDCCFLGPVEAADSIPALASIFAGWSAFADSSTYDGREVQLDPDLTARIEAEGRLTHGSPEEVELRAATVQAIELLAAACTLIPAEIDGALWNRGRERRYKALQRPRSRNTAY